MDTFLNMLAKIPVFAALSTENRDKLAGQAISRRYPKGTAVVRAGDVWPYLFVVYEGALNAVKESSEGRSLIAVTLKPGELFFGLAFFHDQVPSPFTLESYTDSWLYLWPKDVVVPLLKSNGPAAWELSRLVITRMLKAGEIVEGLAFQPVAGRLAYLLLEHFGGHPSDRMARSLTLDEMAARIGTTREMVCRALYKFSDENLIEVNRTEFALINREGLSRLAEQR
jgi:CRP/FNR family transcriptional regulator, cyclic AMP receptor protein